jgi:CheY-like chemotaxis protein
MMASTTKQPELTVLIVDDERQLREYVGRVMSGHGCRVLLAGNGLEGLALLESGEPEIHLVITDVSMPVMTGPEMAARMAGRPGRPPVLFMSGGECQPNLPGPLLRKPFLAAELSTSVRGVLLGKTAPALRLA